MAGQSKKEVVEHVSEVLALCTKLLLRERISATGYGMTVDVDVSKFFDRVHHKRLLSRLTQHIDDDRVLKLIHRMLKAKEVLPDGTRISTDEGAPQGGRPILSILRSSDFI